MPASAMKAIIEVLADETSAACPTGAASRLFHQVRWRSGGRRLERCRPMCPMEAANTMVMPSPSSQVLPYSAHDGETSRLGGGRYDGGPSRWPRCPPNISKRVEDT